MNPQANSRGSAAVTYIPYIFLAGAVVGAVGCLGRADYNLPVFLFGYVAFSYLRGQKHLVAAIFAFSVIVDLLWFFFIYLNVWMRDEYVNLAKWETGIHKMCLVVTIINFVLKVGSVSYSDCVRHFDLHVRQRSENYSRRWKPRSRRSTQIIDPLA